MAEVKIDNKPYQVPEEIAHWMQHAKTIIDKARLLRQHQVTFFKNKDGNELRICKAIEKELDDLIAGKTAENKALQTELFR